MDYSGKDDARLHNVCSRSGCIGGAQIFGSYVRTLVPNREEQKLVSTGT